RALAFQASYAGSIPATRSLGAQRYCGGPLIGVIVPVRAVPPVSVQPIGTAVPGTSERTDWRTSARDAIGVPFNDVLTSPLTSPARSAGFPGTTEWIFASLEMFSSTTPRNAVGPTCTMA